MNLTESKTTDKGYKFVWDFTTSQGNGTISAVCLTHKYGGVGYFGDTFDAGKRLLRMRKEDFKMKAITKIEPSEVRGIQRKRRVAAYCRVSTDMTETQVRGIRGQSWVSPF